MTITTDENGVAETTSSALPYGSYYAKETKRGDGYLINSNWRVDFQIREDGKVVDTSSAADKINRATDTEKSGWFSFTGSIDGPATNQAKLEQMIIRGDIKFFKVDIDGAKQGYIPFLIERLDKDGNVVEAHVILSDKDGNVDTSNVSARGKTSSNVNTLDSYLVGRDSYTGPLNDEAAKANVLFTKPEK